MRKKKILCDAKAFCFGPVSKLLMICEHLKEKYELIFLVSGTSKILSNDGSADRIIECNTEDENELKKNEIEFRKADLFINIMNPVSAKFASKIGIPQIQIDSLFWMWDDISKEVLDSDIYFIQNFEGVEKQLNKFKGKIKNPVIIGPIIKDPLGDIKEKNKLLINLGGMESAFIKVGVNTQYPFVISGILDKMFSRNIDFDEIIFAGNKEVLEKIKLKFPKSKIKFKFFDHNSFLKEIKEAKLILTSPGLTATFEAFNTGTPVFFLPPQNYSQYWNLDNFIQKGIAKYAINWNKIYPEFNILRNEEQKKGVEKILSCIQRFEKDEEAWLKIENSIKSVINTSEYELKDIAKRQKNYIESLGGNGTKKIVEDIGRFLDCEHDAMKQPEKDTIGGKNESIRKTKKNN